MGGKESSYGGFIEAQLRKEAPRIFGGPLRKNKILHDFTKDVLHSFVPCHCNTHGQLRGDILQFFLGARLLDEVARRPDRTTTAQSPPGLLFPIHSTIFLFCVLCIYSKLAVSIFGMYCWGR